MPASTVRELAFTWALESRLPPMCAVLQANSWVSSTTRPVTAKVPSTLTAVPVTSPLALSDPDSSTVESVMVALTTTSPAPDRETLWRGVSNVGDPATISMAVSSVHLKENA